MFDLWLCERAMYASSPSVLAYSARDSDHFFAQKYLQIQYFVLSELNRIYC